MSSRVKYDVTVSVPERWQGFEYEYRHGHANGVLRNRRWCPVSGSVEGGRAREAWKAGYRAGKKAEK